MPCQPAAAKQRWKVRSIDHEFSECSRDHTKYRRLNLVLRSPSQPSRSWLLVLKPEDLRQSTNYEEVIVIRHELVLFLQQLKAHAKSSLPL